MSRLRGAAITGQVSCRRRGRGRRAEQPAGGEGAQCFGEHVDVTSPAARDVVGGDVGEPLRLGGDQGAHLQDRRAQQSGLQETGETEQPLARLGGLGQRGRVGRMAL